MTPGIVRHACSNFFVFLLQKTEDSHVHTVHMGIYAQNAGQRALSGQYLGAPRSYWTG